VIVPALWLGAIAISSQVSRDNSEGFGEKRRDQVPHRKSLRVTVQQQNRRAFASSNGIDIRSCCFDPDTLEALEHPRLLSPEQ
jgi:hypothetical protein